MSQLIASHPIAIANFLGLLIYPLVWFQHTMAKGKGQFLLTNIASCTLFFGAYLLTNEPTAAMISLAAAGSSMIQYFVSKQGLATRAAIALGFIGMIIAYQWPDNIVGWLSIISFAWVRMSEASEERLMRTMAIVSPIIWAFIAVLAQIYSLIALDLMAMALAIRWVYLHLPAMTDGSPAAKDCKIIEPTGFPECDKA